MQGARQVAREFAADILKQFGWKVSRARKYSCLDRTGSQRNLGNGLRRSQSAADHPLPVDLDDAGVSPDGTRVAFTSFVRSQPEIRCTLLDAANCLFFNQNASMNATPGFTSRRQTDPFSSTPAGGYAQIYIANVNGSNLKRLTH